MGYNQAEKDRQKANHEMEIGDRGKLDQALRSYKTAKSLYELAGDKRGALEAALKISETKIRIAEKESSRYADLANKADAGAAKEWSAAALNEGQKIKEEQARLDKLRKELEKYAG